MQLGRTLKGLTVCALLAYPLATGAATRTASEIAQDMLRHSNAAQAASAAAVEAYKAKDQDGMCRNVATTVDEAKLAVDLSLAYQDAVIAEARQAGEDVAKYTEGLKALVTSLQASHAEAARRYQEICA